MVQIVVVIAREARGATPRLAKCLPMLGKSGDTAEKRRC